MTRTVIYSTTYAASQGYTTEVYRYDGLNRLTGVERDGVQTDLRLYDGASRVVQTGPNGQPAAYINALNGTNWTGEALAGTGSETRVNRYNANGQILSQKVYKAGPSGEKVEKTTINYENAGGYDATGNLMGYVVADHASGRVSTFVNTYEWGETARQKTSRGTSNQTSPGTTTWGYDVNGQLTSVSDATLQANNRSFVNDMGGTALYVAQGTHVQRQLVVDGEVLGRYGEIRDALNPTSQNGVQNFQTSAQFNFGYQPVDGNYPSASPGTYAVAQGDTLQGIARGAYGDESLWYLIAEANGLSGNADLKAGQVLTVPTRVSSANNAGTFKPYDPSAVVGDTTPNMPVPKPKSSGWGFFGKLLMVVVAVVVTVWTAGAAAAYFGVAMGQVSAATVAIGAGAAAVGSAVSQGVGVAIGAQDSFSWKGVALSAIGGGVAAGMGGVNFTGADAASGSVSSLGNRIVQGAVGNALTQGVAVATGLQSSFSWKSVAISAVSAGAAKGMNAAMGYDPMTQGFDFGKSLVSGIGASVMVSAARGGKFDAAQVATDAFGNIIGDSLAWANSSANPSGSNYANQMDRGAQGFGNALGDSIAAANGQGVVPGPVSDTEQQAIMGYFAGGPGTGLSFADDMAMRRAGLNPMGLPTYVGSDDPALAYDHRNGSDVASDSYNGSRRTATVRSGQGPLAALADLGLNPAQQQAGYGYLLTTGQVQIGRNGVPMVQPGQQLHIDLDDMNQAGLAARAIAQESSMRTDRATAAAQAATDSANAAETRKLFNSSVSSPAYRNEDFSNEARGSMGSPSTRISSLDAAKSSIAIEKDFQSLMRSQPDSPEGWAARGNMLADLSTKYQNTMQSAGLKPDPMLLTTMGFQRSIANYQLNGDVSQLASSAIAAGVILGMETGPRTEPMGAGHNAALAVEYRNVLRTTEAANPLVESLQATGALPAN